MEKLFDLKQKSDKLEKEITLLEKSKDQTIEIFKSLITEFTNTNSIDCNLEVGEFRIRFYYPYSTYNGNDITIFNNSHSSDFEFKPKLTWSSGSISPDDNIRIKYLKAINLFSCIFIEDSSGLLKEIKKYFRKNHRINKKINDVAKERNVILREIYRIEEEIRKERFYKNYEQGNFYFNYEKRRYGSGIYDINYVEKINNKTSNIISYRSSDISDVKRFVQNVDRFRKNRIRNNEVFHKLEKHTSFKEEEFDNILLNHNIKIHMKRIFDNYDINHIKDIKLLCMTLFKNGVINSKIPSNDILSIISEKRHYILKYGEIR